MGQTPLSHTLKPQFLVKYSVQSGCDINPSQGNTGRSRPKPIRRIQGEMLQIALVPAMLEHRDEAHG